MRTFAQRQPKAKKLTLAAIPRRKSAAAESTQYKHPVLRLQHTLGNRATRQILLARAQELEGKKVLALAPDASKPAPTAATADQSHIPTNWFLDFWGVGNGGRQKGRGDRQDKDVAVVKNLTIGPKDEAKVIEHAGDALSSGYSHLGSFSHRKGHGSATGSVSYAQQKDIEVKLIFSEKADKKVLAAAKAAAQKRVEELILKNSAISGDWSEVERQAAAAAAEHLPEGSDPKVEITLKGQHQQEPLDTVDYNVQNPAVCTAKIVVPTTTTSVGWSRTDTQEHGNKAETTTLDKTHVEVDAGGSKQHKDDKSSSSVDVKTDSKTDTTKDHKSTKTHTETEYGISWDDIEKSSKQIAEHMALSVCNSWKLVTKKLQDTTGGGVVSADEGPGLSLGDKIKRWLKEKGKQALGAAKDFLVKKVKDIVKDKVKGFVKKMIGAEAWWFTILDWGIDFVGDELKGKLWVNKSKDQQGANGQPPHSSNQAQDSTLDWVYYAVHEASMASQQETEQHLSGHFSDIYKKDEESTSDKSSTHSSGSTSVKTSSGSSSDSDTSHSDVKSASDAQQKKEDLQLEHVTTSRTYHGTTISVIAGHPVLQVTVEEQS